MATSKLIWRSGDNIPTFSYVLNSTSNSASGIAKVDYLEMTYNMNAATNSYLYVDLSSITSYTIQSGDYLEYDIYNETTSAIVGIDFQGTMTGGNMRDYGGGSIVDQNGLKAHPNTNLSAYATQQWYHRKIYIGGMGGTINDFCLACENDAAGTYKVRFKNIAITNGNGITKSQDGKLLTFFN